VKAGEISFPDGLSLKAAYFASLEFHVELGKDFTQRRLTISRPLCLYRKTDRKREFSQRASRNASWNWRFHVERSSGVTHR